VMALWKYVKPVSIADSGKQDGTDGSQPRRVVCLVPDNGKHRNKSRSSYISLSLEKKAEIGK